MKAFLFAYYVIFVLDVHPEFMRRGWQRRQVYEAASEVAYKTDADPGEGLRMMQIAARETGYDKTAVGKAGERGRWQVLGGNDFSAKEALRRMRVQGMVAFVGCRHAEDKVTLPNGVKTTCQEMVDDRIGPADRYLTEHRPPTTLQPENGYAGNP
jgi:hypothetical protein